MQYKKKTEVLTKTINYEKHKNNFNSSSIGSIKH